jgi:hypothetical protein
MISLIAISKKHPSFPLTEIEKMLLWKRPQVKAFRTKGQGKNRKQAVSFRKECDTIKKKQPGGRKKREKMAEA